MKIELEDCLDRIFILPESANPKNVLAANPHTENCQSSGV